MPAEPRPGAADGDRAAAGAGRSRRGPAEGGHDAPGPRRTMPPPAEPKKKGLSQPVKVAIFILIFLVALHRAGQVLMDPTSTKTHFTPTTASTRTSAFSTGSGATAPPTGANTHGSRPSPWRRAWRSSGRWGTRMSGPEPSAGFSRSRCAPSTSPRTRRRWNGTSPTAVSWARVPRNRAGEHRRRPVAFSAVQVVTVTGDKHLLKYQADARP
jgi:hypothetical protein